MNVEAAAVKGDAPGGFRIASGQMLVCLGDSITQNPMGYCAMIAALIAGSYPDRAIRVINAGIGGNKVPDMLARLERDVLAHQPDWVTVSVGVSVGVNDVWHGLAGGRSGVPLEEYRAGIEVLLDRLTAAGAQPVLLPPTVIGEAPDSEGNLLLREYRAAMRSVGKARGLIIAPTDIDFDAALQVQTSTLLQKPPVGTAGQTLTTDGVHMRPPGDAVLAVAVLKALDFFP